MSIPLKENEKLHACFPSVILREKPIHVIKPVIYAILRSKKVFVNYLCLFYREIGYLQSNFLPPLENMTEDVVLPTSVADKEGYF
jgi:hypothetical protein